MHIGLMYNSENEIGIISFGIANKTIKDKFNFYNQLLGTNDCYQSVQKINVIVLQSKSR